MQSGLSTATPQSNKTEWTDRINKLKAARNALPTVSGKTALKDLLQGKGLLGLVKFVLSNFECANSKMFLDDMISHMEGGWSEKDAYEASKWRME